LSVIGWDVLSGGSARACAGPIRLRPKGRQPLILPRTVKLTASEIVMYYTIMPATIA
jgi:hypothetical protein